MKLSQLNVALRDLKGNPKIRLRLFDEDETGMDLTIEKSKFMASLKERFDNRGAETGLTLTEEGFISREPT